MTNFFTENSSALIGSIPVGLGTIVLIITSIIRSYRAKPRRRYYR